MKNLSEKTAGTIIAVTAVVVLSPDVLLISLVSADDWTLIFWRGLLTSITLTVSLVSVHGKDFFKQVKRIGRYGLLAAFFFAVSTISFVTSVRLTSAANSLVIVAAMPLIAAVFSRLLLKEYVPRRTWIAVATGFAGITVVFAGSMTGGSPLGDSLAFLTAVMMAANFVIIRSQKQLSMIPAVVLSGILTTAMTSFLCDPLTLTITDMLFVIIIGAVVLPVPLALMTVAPKFIPAAEVGLVMLLETFLGPYWVWLVLDQVPERETVAGGSILILTLVVHFYFGLKEERKVSS